MSAPIAFFTIMMSFALGLVIGSGVESSTDFEYIAFTENCGLSAAIKAGFDHADTELVGYIDSDLQTAPDDFNILIEEKNEVIQIMVKDNGIGMDQTHVEDEKSTFGYNFLLIKYSVICI